MILFVGAGVFSRSAPARLGRAQSRPSPFCGFRSRQSCSVVSRPGPVGPSFTATHLQRFTSQQVGFPGLSPSLRVFVSLRVCPWPGERCPCSPVSFRFVLRGPVACRADRPCFWLALCSSSPCKSAWPEARVLFRSIIDAHATIPKSKSQVPSKKQLPKFGVPVWAF